MQTVPVGDLYAAAYLVAEGFEFPAIQPDGHRKLFVFEPGGRDLKTLLQTLHRGEATVNALVFIRAIRELKTAIHF